MHRWVIVVAAAACSPAPRPADPVDPATAPAPVAMVIDAAPAPPAVDAFATIFVPPKGACVAAGDRSLARAEADARVQAQASFQAELARQHLKLAVIPQHTRQLQLGMNLTAAGRSTPGTVVHATVDKVTGDFVVGTTWWTGSPSTPPAWEFVMDEHGDVYQLARRADSTITEVLVCGCAPQQCPRYGSPCPACGATVEALYGPLPAGAHFRGDMIVEFRADAVIEQYEGGRCAPLKCPPPPP